MENLVETPPPVRALGPLPVAGQLAVQRIGLLLFDGCSLLAAGVIAEAFRIANELEIEQHRRPFYQLSLLSHHGGNIACSSSVRIWTQGLEAAGQRGFGAIFIACSEQEPAGERAARVMSTTLEIGAAALEWRHSGRDVLPPRVSRATAAIAGDLGIHIAPATVFWCRGGSLAAPEVMPSAMDLALAQIEGDLGPSMAQEVGRRLSPRRDATGADGESPDPGDSAGDRDDELLPDMSAATANKIHASARWMTEHYMEAISVADAARFAAMSERNYLRRFKCTIGVTPSEYLLRARLDMSCKLLTRTTLPVDKVARRCGMGNGDRLCKIFRKRFALSPTEYRMRHHNTGGGSTSPLLEER
ncbi:GlxA family transcriptional regulator [Cupriavidus plantarum]|uniref:GlxA family transcriptional regulator n=1 Tax=Cupriavidus plantarum TaxID=942865 RepID=UPI000E257F85|nr:helix-turn-helix domain-containing protein [Cupriavidus plantarum]NYI00847.1 transcriptional regulator GlxA family with amidase domain [Cupriavidus plantarum]REE93703.1 transcriptional regulator GlxA family with amidase domain [Cupriavidus plantarum]